MLLHLLGASYIIVPRILARSVQAGLSKKHEKKKLCWFVLAHSGRLYISSLFLSFGPPLHLLRPLPPRFRSFDEPFAKLVVGVTPLLESRRSVLLCPWSCFASFRHLPWLLAASDECCRSLRLAFDPSLVFMFRSPIFPTVRP